jgi:hypothetical protein
LPIDAKLVFQAETKTVLELLGHPGRFFYIPPYQRDYSWDKPKIDRLAADVMDGLRDSAERSGVLSFIGAVIVVHDTEGQLVHPVVQPQLPSAVFVIIDGQQRCTTLALWSVVLCSAISSRLAAIEKAKAVEGFEQVIAKAQRLSAELERVIHENLYGPDPDLSWYPRIIRSPDDQWSTRSGEALYSSPIASALSQASRWARRSERAEFEYELPSLPDSELKRYRVVSSALRRLDQLTENFLKGKYPSESDADLTDQSPISVLDSRNLQEMVFGAALANADVVRLNDLIGPGGGRAAKHAGALLRLVALAEYLLRRVAITHIAAKAESYAFDMFDSLNTTGEPLTAYETFRPRVIKSVGLSAFRVSRHAEVLRLLDQSLPASGPEKEKSTAQFLIHAALYEDGTRLSKKRGKQRDWIQAAWERAAQQPDGGLGLLWGMNSVAEVSRMFEAPREQVQVMGGQQTQLALEYLGDTKHEMAIPLLSAYWSGVASAAPGALRDSWMNGFRRLVRACFAFSVLWRGARGGTAGIDDAYRRIMRGDSHLEIEAMNRLNRTTKDPDTQCRAISSAFKRLLGEHSLDDAAKWAVSAASHPMGASQIEVAKVLLGAASEDVITCSEHVGIVKLGLRDTCPQLRADAPWWADAYELEHVAPQRPSSVSDWDRSIYAIESNVHFLGNLTLLPKWVNCGIQNGNWGKKRLIYRMLAASTADELNAVCREGLDLQQVVGSQRTHDEILSAGRHLPATKALGQVATWDFEFIRKRSENIAQIAFARLYPWLG